MKNTILLLLLVLFITGCDDDLMEEDTNHDFISAESMSKDNTGGGTYLGGQYYNLDSITRYAIIKYNDRSITDIAVNMIQGILERKKVFEYENSLVKKYGYELSPGTYDSLRYYNYDKSFIGKVGEDKDITVYGTSPYKDKGIWESFVVKGYKLETMHPTLYKKAIDSFFKLTSPKITDKVIENQGGNFIEYSIKVTFSIGTEQYVRFSILNKNEHIVVDLEHTEAKPEQ